MSTSQWERLLKNEGIWVGSFTQLAADGSVQHEVPSVVALKPLDGGTLMRQEITKMPPGEAPQITVLEYRSLARSVLFLENGAFSQGSIQWGPYSEFGAELGLIAEPHRLRLVQLFDRESRLSQLTLIREHREEAEPSQRSPLTLPHLIGTWVGEAVTWHPDFRPPLTSPTHLTVTGSGATVQQTLSFGATPPIQSTGIVRGDRLQFTTDTQTIQVLLLPDGASATCPLTLTPRQSFFLEVGWLITPTQRQRLIRRYNAQGGWESLTLVTETKL